MSTIFTKFSGMACVKTTHWWKLQKFMYRTLRILTLFWQKFRETNVFTKEITKQLIWRNYFSVRVIFPQCALAKKLLKFVLTISQCGKTRDYLSPKKYFVKSILLCNVTFTKFLPKKCERWNYHNFHTMNECFCSNKESFCRP